MWQIQRVRRLNYFKFENCKCWQWITFLHSGRKITKLVSAYFKYHLCTNERIALSTQITESRIIVWVNKIQAGSNVSNECNNQSTLYCCKNIWISVIQSWNEHPHSKALKVIKKWLLTLIRMLNGQLYNFLNLSSTFSTDFEAPKHYTKVW